MPAAFTHAASPLSPGLCVCGAYSLSSLVAGWWLLKRVSTFRCHRRVNGAPLDGFKGSINNHVVNAVLERILINAPGAFLYPLAPAVRKAHSPLILRARLARLVFLEAMAVPM